MKFQCKFLSADGDIEDSVIEADSERSALRELSKQGLTALEVKEQKKKKAGNPGKIKQAELLQLLDELVTLLRSGVSLVDSVNSLTETQIKPVLEVALENMSLGLQQGKPFSTVLQESKLSIPRYILQLTEAGELTGKLAEALSEGVEQMHFDEQLMSESRNALVYPAILVFSGVIAIGLVFTLVVPKFSNLLQDDVALPALAELVLRVGLFFNENGLYVLICIILTTVFASSALSKPRFRRQLLDSVSKWPVVGDWLVETETSRWAAVLGALLNNGVPLIDSLNLANSGVRISSRRKKLNKAVQSIKGGEALSQALKAQDALLPTAYNILKVGEKAGELPAMLKSLAALYEKSGRNRMRKMLILIEPLAILLIGGVIGTIIIGIVLAITSSSDIPI